MIVVPSKNSDFANTSFDARERLCHTMQVQLKCTSMIRLPREIWQEILLNLDRFALDAVESVSVLHRSIVDVAFRESCLRRLSKCWVFSYSTDYGVNIEADNGRKLSCQGEYDRIVRFLLRSARQSYLKDLSFSEVPMPSIFFKDLARLGELVIVNKFRVCVTSLICSNLGRTPALFLSHQSNGRISRRSAPICAEFSRPAGSGYSLKAVSRSYQRRVPGTVRRSRHLHSAITHRASERRRVRR